MSSCATDCPANVAVIRASDEKHGESRYDKCNDCVVGTCIGMCCCCFRLKDADRRVAETAYDLLENMDVEGKVRVLM